MSSAADAATVDAYIAAFPAPVQARLQEIRRVIRRAAPASAEAISYRIPAMTIGGATVLYFAGWKHHISLYPAPVGDDPDLETELRPLRSGQSTLKFPLAVPLPVDLIEAVVRSRVAAIAS